MKESEAKEVPRNQTIGRVDAENGLGGGGVDLLAEAAPTARAPIGRPVSVLYRNCLADTVNSGVGGWWAFENVVWWKVRQQVHWCHFDSFSFITLQRCRVWSSLDGSWTLESSPRVQTVTTP